MSAIADVPRSNRRSATPTLAENPALHRLFSFVITLAAAFIAWLGLFHPTKMDDRFTWAVLPPLHARFVGALYLFGAIYTLGGALSAHRRTVAPTMVGITLFTGAMGVLTALNARSFDWDLFPVRVWVISYVAYPLISAALTVRYRTLTGAEVPGPELPTWARRVLQVQAGAFIAIGATGLLVRSLLVDAWPWEVTAPVAQMYGGVFLALGVVTALHARARRLREVTWLAASTAALAATTLWASLHHRALFSSTSPSSGVWFGAAIALLVGHVLVLVRTGGGLSARHGPRR
jgi:hypothetical protein